MVPHMGIYKPIEDLASTPVGRPVNIMGKVLRISEPQESARRTWIDIYMADLSSSMIKVRLWGSLANLGSGMVGKVYIIEGGKLCEHKEMLRIHADEGETIVHEAPESELSFAIKDRVDENLNSHTDVTLTKIEEVRIADLFEGHMRDVNGVVTISDCSVNQVIDDTYRGCFYCKSAVNPYVGGCQSQTCIYAGQAKAIKQVIRVKLVLRDSPGERPLYVSAFSDVVTDILGKSSEECLAMDEYERADMVQERLSRGSISVVLDVIWKGRRVYPLGTVIDIKY